MSEELTYPKIENPIPKKLFELTLNRDLYNSIYHEIKKTFVKAFSEFLDIGTIEEQDSNENKQQKQKIFNDTIINRLLSECNEEQRYDFLCAAALDKKNISKMVRPNMLEQPWAGLFFDTRKGKKNVWQAILVVYDYHIHESFSIDFCNSFNFEDRQAKVRAWLNSGLMQSLEYVDLESLKGPYQQQRKLSVFAEAIEFLKKSRCDYYSQKDINQSDIEKLDMLVKYDPNAIKYEYPNSDRDILGKLIEDLDYDVGNNRYLNHVTYPLAKWLATKLFEQRYDFKPTLEKVEQAYSFVNNHLGIEKRAADGSENKIQELQENTQCLQLFKQLLTDYANTPQIRDHQLRPNERKAVTEGTQPDYTTKA